MHFYFLLVTVKCLPLSFSFSLISHLCLRPVYCTPEVPGPPEVIHHVAVLKMAAAPARPEVIQLWSPFLWTPGYSTAAHIPAHYSKQTGDNTN